MCHLAANLLTVVILLVVLVMVARAGWGKGDE